MIWNDEAVEELKRMWDRGMTTGQIAKALNVTKNSIIGKVHRLCLTARPSPIKKVSVKNEKKTVSVENPVKVPKPEPKTPAVSVSQASTVTEKTPEVDEVTNIPLVKLDNHTCRWPIGDPRDDTFCFCGKRVKTGQTYCDEHSAIAYVRTGKKA